MIKMAFGFIFLLTAFSAFAGQETKDSLLKEAYDELQMIDWRHLPLESQAHFSKAYHALKKAAAEQYATTTAEATVRIATAERAVFSQVGPLCNAAKKSAEDKAKHECLKRVGRECKVSSSVIVGNWVVGNWYYEQAYLHCKAEAIVVPAAIEISSGVATVNQ